MDLFDFSASRLARLGRAALIGLAATLLVACGGDDGDAPAGPDAVAPSITQQPADASVTAGQSVTFATTAAGTAPLTWQWQRNGVDIAGATAAGYTLSTTALADGGAAFHVVVHNVAGSATSRDAVLAVTAAAPVLTITAQPADVAAVAGATATFSVAATCSAGTLDIQWQRNSGANGAFVAIPGATAGRLAVTTSIADNAAQFRAALDCGGLAASTSGVATLAVSAPAGVRVDLLPVAGLRPQGAIGFAGAMAVDPDGSITFTAENFVGRLGADLSTITHFAGGGAGSIVDGTTATASFSQLNGCATDAAGNVYVTDNSTLRKIAIDGTVTTFAGSTSGGNVDATGTAARFGEPYGLAFGPDGDLYVADATNHSIRRVTPAGVVTTYAGDGSGMPGYRDGAPGQARFSSPWGIAVAANGDVLVADLGNHRIRRIARSGTGAGSVSALAGNGLTGSGADGVGGNAVVERPIGLAVHGNTLTVLQGVGLIRQVDLATAAVTTLAGTYAANPAGFADGSRAQARFTGNGGIAALGDGRFIVGDGSAIRVISAAGDVRTIAVAGGGDAFADDGGVLAQRPFSFASNTPQALAVDPSGRVVVASSGDVRRIGAAGDVGLVAGISGSILGMLDGNGSAAQFSSVGSGIATAPDGTLYVSDAASLRKIDTAGNVTLLAGYRVLFIDPVGGTSYGAVDGDSATARFQNQLKMAVGPDGALYVADAANGAIRRVDASGNTTTWAGALGVSAMVDGPRSTARFRAPTSLAFAPDGTLWVTDNGALRQVGADGATVSTVLTGGGFGQVAIDGSGNLFMTAADGLHEIAAGTSTPVRLVAGGANDALVTGTSPHLGRIDSLAVLAPGQLVLISGYQLVKVTLP